MNIVKSALKVFGIKGANDKSSKKGDVSLESFLSDLPEYLNHDIEFTSSLKEDGSTHVEVGGDEAEKFVGSNTAILDSLAHLSMRVKRKEEGATNKTLDEIEKPERLRVSFDCNGFREQKKEGLFVLAEKARQKVIDKDGKPAYLPPLSPSERKVVHTRLAELGEVTSESMGKGTFKRIKVKLINAKRKSQDSRPQKNHSGASSKKNSNKDFNSSDKNFNNKEVDGNKVQAEESFNQIDDNIGNR